MPVPEFFLHLLGEEYLEQRLIGHVALVGQRLQTNEDRLRQSQGDRLGGGFQIREDRPFRLGNPIYQAKAS